MPVPLGTHARYLREIARWALLVVVLTAPMTLWWPSVEGWAALGIATLAIWLLWLCWRTLTGETDIPGHLLHLALIGIWVIACYHVPQSGVGEPGARPLQGQFASSLATHISLIALMVLLVGDLLARRPLGALIPTLFGLAALCGAFMGLLISHRDEGRLMLALMGWTGLGVFCWPLCRRRPDPEGRPGALWRRIGRYGRMALALIAAAALAVLCPLSVLMATAAATVTLLVAAVCLRGRLASFGLAALVAAISGGAHAWTLGWIRAPAWPRSLTDWIGSGGDALARLGPWTNDLALLVGAVGWVGGLWLIIGLLGCLVWGLWTARGGRREEHSQAVLASFTAVLAAIAWLSPGGLFNPAVNVTFVAVWAIWPIALGRAKTRRSGWWVLAVVMGLSLALALASKIGLLAWTAGLYDGDDDLLHVLIGWLTTHVMLWLLTKARRGPYIAVALSMAGAIAGEVAQMWVSNRSAEMIDLFSHAKGAALAVGIYVLCRACQWSESPDVPDRRYNPDPQTLPLDR